MFVVRGVRCARVVWLASRRRQHSGRGLGAGEGGVRYRRAAPLSYRSTIHRVVAKLSHLLYCPGWNLVRPRSRDNSRDDVVIGALREIMRRRPPRFFDILWIAAGHRSCITTAIHKQCQCATSDVLRPMIRSCRSRGIAGYFPNLALCPSLI